MDGATVEEIFALLEEYGLEPSSRWQVCTSDYCVVAVPSGADPRDYFVDFASRDPSRFGEESLVEYATPIYYNAEIYASAEIASREMIIQTSLIIKFDHNTTIEEENLFLERYGLLRNPMNFEDDPFLVADIPDTKSYSVLDVVEFIKTHEDVEWVAPGWGILGGVLQAGTPDLDFDAMWNLQDLSKHGIDMLPAWSISEGDPNVIIAIIDTGIEFNHPELADKIITAGMYDLINNDEYPEDIYACADTGYIGHGTATASIAAANKFNGNFLADGDMSGICPNCSILPFKVFNCKYTTEIAIAAAIRRAVDAGAKVISMSLGGPPPLSEWENYELLRAMTLWVTTFVASGNEGTDYISCPACSIYAFAVGASDQSGQKAWFSNWGKGLNLIAPGVNTRAAALNGGMRNDFGGTSGATPHAAGVAGLLYSYLPSLTPEDIWLILGATADDIDPPGWDVYTGHGKLNAGAALEYLKSRRPVAVARAFTNWNGALQEDKITVKTRETVLLDAWASHDPKGGGITCHWYPQGTMGVDYYITDQNSCRVTTMYIWKAQPATFNLNLIVTDSDGWQSEPDPLTVETIYMPEAVPLARGESDTEWSSTGVSVYINDLVYLDGISASWDSEGGYPLSCVWDLGGGWDTDYIEDENSCLTVVHTSAAHISPPMEALLVVTNTAGKQSYPASIPIEVYSYTTMCLFSESAYAGQEDILETLRLFRDKTMAPGMKGHKYARIYYQHSAEVTGIMIANSRKRIQMWGFIQRYIPLIEKFVNDQMAPGQNNRIFTPGDAKTLKVFIDDLIALAGPVLREDLERLKQDMDYYTGWRFEDIFQDLQTN